MKDNMNRRSFLGTTMLAAGSALGMTKVGQGATAPRTASGRRPNPIAVSTYSFWRFKQGLKMPIKQCIDEAARLGFDGLDILLRQMESERNVAPDNATLQGIKRHALINGIDLCCMSTHQGFVYQDKAKRQNNVDLTVQQIETAYKLGVPIVRVNTGRWGTSGNFDELMANRGIEPVLDGYTEADGYKWVIDSLTACLPTAEKCGVILGLENHWGMARTPEGLLRIANAIDSPWLEVLLDTGNFLEEPYDKLDMCAPQTVFMQAKTYFGGGIWYTLDLDYQRIGRIMRKHNFQGYVSLEFEGEEDWRTAIPKSLAILRKAFS